MNRTGRLPGYVWLCVLAAVLACSALVTERRSRQTEEYAYGCDSFGYLQSAQEIRQTAAARKWPRFNLESPHTRLLIQSMQARQIPLEQWEEMIAPHAYHYFQHSGLVGVVYPPGAALSLAIFPQGEALHRLNRAVIVVFLATGLCALIIAACRQAWLSAGIVILALHLGLEVLGRIGNASFSINAMLAPLLLSSLCLFLALGFATRSGGRSQSGVLLFALFSGLLFGFAVLARLPVLFLLPGLLVLMLPTELRDWRRSPLLPFGFGFLVGGVLPLGVFQSRLAGAWYLPTYANSNIAPPTFEVFRSNVAFYLGGGDGSTDNWALIVLILTCVFVFWWPGRLGRSDSKRSGSVTWSRLTLAALLMWSVPTAYFLTHRIFIHYYAVPATFATVLLLALGAFFIETKEARFDRNRGSWIRVIALVLITLAPGVVVIWRVWSTYVPPTAEARTFQFRLPAELADERAWVWAGMLTGTLWYYFRKPAHKIQFSGTETRATVYDFVFKRGEPQFIIRDSPDMQPIEDEIAALGGTLELRGDVNGYPYFLIHWPPAGPRIGARARL